MSGYLHVLADLHKTVRPSTYLEIGVFRGDSLRLAGNASTYVGVDPDPEVPMEDALSGHIERTTSDAFFNSTRPRELFGDRPVDMVFIDGMHLFEYALRDFMGAEALAGEHSLITIHDCLPLDRETSSRERLQDCWTGDIWKLILCLLDHRPDLQLTITDAPPSGLCLVRKPDPASRILHDKYDALIDEYMPMDYSVWESRLPDVLRRTATSLEARYYSRLAEVGALRERVAALESSTSWRVTAPLRRVCALIGRGQSSKRNADA